MASPRKTSFPAHARGFDTLWHEDVLALAGDEYGDEFRPNNRYGLRLGLSTPVFVQILVSSLA